jgi:hypothetical protein
MGCCRRTGVTSCTTRAATVSCCSFLVNPICYTYHSMRAYAATSYYRRADPLRKRRGTPELVSRGIQVRPEFTPLRRGRGVFGLEHEKVASAFSNLCPLPYAAREIRGSTTFASEVARDGIGTDTLSSVSDLDEVRGPHRSRLGNGTFLSTESGRPFRFIRDSEELSLAHAQTGEPTHPEPV